MGLLDSLDSFFISLEQWLWSAWNSLVLQEQRHPVILAIALFIVLSVLLSCLFNLCCWCCGLCRPRQRQPGLVFVPANYGTIIYPPGPGQKGPILQQPQQQQQQQGGQAEPRPSTSKDPHSV